MKLSIPIIHSRTNGLYYLILPTGSLECFQLSEAIRKAMGMGGEPVLEIYYERRRP